MFFFVKKIKKRIKEIYVNATEFPLQPVQKKVLPKRQLPERAIPSVVYQTWRSNFFGKTHAQGIAHFRELNPDMEFNLFDDKDVNASCCNSHCQGTCCFYVGYSPGSGGCSLKLLSRILAGVGSRSGEPSLPAIG